jgi:hypothetical protein
VTRRHLDLRQLKALAGRLSIAKTLQSEALQELNAAAQSAQMDEVNFMNAAADALRSQEPGPLDAALKTLGKTAAQRARLISGEGPAFDQLRTRLRELARTLKKFDCQTCAGANNPICCGKPTVDDKNLSEQGDCIELIHDVLRFVNEQSRQVYGHAAVRIPTVTLSTHHTHDKADSELFKAFNVSGFCEVLNDQAVTSVIGLVIKEGAFDWTALCALPYLLTHEVICHAYQDLHHCERSSADEKCLWSEGWMDRLAYMLVHDWTKGNGKRQFPSWLLVDGINVTEQTNAIHHWRYQPRNSLRTSEAEQLNEARRTFDLLVQLWHPKRLLESRPLEQHAIAKFSTALNACHVANQLREDIVIKLRGLLRTKNIKAETALQICANFAEGTPIPPSLASLARSGTEAIGEGSAPNPSTRAGSLFKILTEIEKIGVAELTRLARETRIANNVSTGQINVHQRHRRS